ncbi:MAG: cytochrome c oxidase subunit II [Betaproteobacteria bacterium]|nr:cytochrome c oxidase subunit II [Betaproteobacteria bacterium]
MSEHRRLWAGLAAFAATGPALAEKYIPSTDRIVDPAAGWERLWSEVLIDITVLGVLFAVVLAYLILKYRRRAGVEGGGAPHLTTGAAIAWSVIPAFIFLADDMFLAAHGWQLWNVQRQVPADRLEISLESGMYSWDYTYPNGVHTQNELKVPAGKPVLLRMTSRDTIHNHYIPDFKIKEDSMPGRITYIWFYPQKPGKHLVTCNEYCGVSHSYMSGQVVVLPPEEYNAWYAQEGGKVKQAAVPASPAPASAAKTDPATQNDKSV